MHTTMPPDKSEGPRMARMRDGVQISYRLHKGQGKARFALVHSLAMDGGFWDLVTKELGRTGDVLVYDCRGHGNSTKPAGPYRAEIFADDLADLLQEIGWDSAVVAGASMGGCVALAFAEAYPEKLEALGLIDTTAWYGENAPAEWEGRAQKALTGGLSGLVEFQKSRWFSDDFPSRQAAIVDMALAVFLANDVAAYAETCRMLGHFDKRVALAGIHVPVTILVGAEDYAAPVAMAEAMHRAIPNSTLHVIDRVRHLTPLECPEIVAEKLRDVAVQRYG
jgi:3-oxoadipate enol-lactonase